MLSTATIALSSKEDLRILIVCLNSTTEEIRTTVGSLAYKSWEKTGEIGLLTIPDRLRHFKKVTSEEIDKKTGGSADPVPILIYGEITVDEEIGGSDDDRKLIRAPSLSVFRKKLKNLLQKYGLDTRSYWAKTLASGEWDISKGHIDRWIEQFDRLGQVSWIGETLLRELNFWSWKRFTRALNLSPAWLREFDCISFDNSLGSSGQRLGHFVAKAMEGNTAITIAPSLSEMLIRRASKILYIEDALLTGTEMIQKLSTLMTSLGADVINSNHLELFFPICTSLGQARLLSFLRKSGLTEIGIKYSSQGYLNVLSPDGQKVFKNSQTSGEDKTKILSYIVRPIFTDQGIWKSDDHVTRALKFCRSIGSQLTAGPSIEHPEIPVSDDSALGTWALALALAYPYSIPNSTLPLFWARGRVYWDGGQIDWIPLL
jgi:hypothetical protein